MAKLGNWLKDDLAIKVFSVVLALLLWINVAGPQQALSTAPVQDRADNIPVTWRNLPPGLSVDQVVPSDVSVTYRAQQDVANGVSNQSFTAVVDLAGAAAGRLAFSVDVAVPAGVQLVSVSPARVTLTLVPVRSATVPVQSAVTGEPAANHRALDPVVKPENAAVRGASDDVARVDHLLATIDVTGKSSDVTADVALQPVDAAGKPVPDVTVEPDTVQMTVPIVEWSGETLPVQPLIEGVPASGYHIEGVSVAPQAVTISGGASVLGGLTQLLTVPVNVSGATQTVTRTVEVQAPQGTTPNPDQVDVTVVVAPNPSQ